MLSKIDQHLWTELLAEIKETYTGKLGWDVSANENYIEGAVIDAVH